jgi:GAF domain-containing protein
MYDASSDEARSHTNSLIPPPLTYRHTRYDARAQAQTASFDASLRFQPDDAISPVDKEGIALRIPHPQFYPQAFWRRHGVSCAGVEIIVPTFRVRFRAGRGTLGILKLADEFKTTIKTDGLWAAMRWLNGQVPYRYTAIFAFQGDMLRNICLVDKHDWDITRCADQPITDSYCIYIHRSSMSFGVDEALSDARVAGHPKRRAYQCYYGIPLFAPDGKLLGTVCHFDADPISVTAGIVSALDDLAPFIAEAAFG